MIETLNDKLIQNIMGQISISLATMPVLRKRFKEFFLLEKFITI
jgi:hypothetical protein